jgi:hypothetical protein
MCDVNCLCCCVEHALCLSCDLSCPSPSAPLACISLPVLHTCTAHLYCRYESLGNDGMGSMYRWFEAYQDEHFPDPMGLRAMAHK